MATQPFFPELVPCGDCGAGMVLRNSRYGQFYSCSRYPACKGRHGCHPNGKPLGIPANQETRQARMAAHGAFDPIAQRIGRKAAYKWLAEKMNLTKHEAHIGKFTLEQCEEVCRIVAIDPP